MKSQKHVTNERTRGTNDMKGTVPLFRVRCGTFQQFDGQRPFEITKRWGMHIRWHLICHISRQHAHVFSGRVLQVLSHPSAIFFIGFTSLKIHFSYDSALMRSIDLKCIYVDHSKNLTRFFPFHFYAYHFNLSNISLKNQRFIALNLSKHIFFSATVFLNLVFFSNPCSPWNGMKENLRFNR